MKRVEALNNLFKGNKIRSTDWDKGDYQQKNVDGDTIFYSAADDESIVIDSDNINRNLYNKILFPEENDLNLNPIKASCDIEYKLISYYRAYRKELKDNKDYDKWEVIDYCKQTKQTSIEIGSMVRFIEDIDFFSKGDYAEIFEEYDDKHYHIEDNSRHFHLISKSSVIHVNDYKE